MAKEGTVGPALSPWPVRRPAYWVDRVNAPAKPEEDATLILCIRRGQPFGVPDWRVETAARLGLTSTMRPRGRPRKRPDDAP